MKEKAEKQSNDIIKLILEDHKPLKELIKILKDDEANAGERLVAFEKFAPLLLSHAKPEEQSLYVFMKEDEELVVEGMEGDTEHEIADRLINEIYETENENLWSAKVKVLAELVEHHIKEEEETMLPDFEENSTQEERASLGQEYLSMKNQMNNETFSQTSEVNDSLQAH